MNSLRFSRAGRWVCLLMIVFVFCGCDSDDPVIGPTDPHAPYRPELVAPESNAQNQPRQLTLKWTCSDPDGDSLRYDVILAKNRVIPTRVAKDITDTSFTIWDLDSGTTYYWRVIAKDPDTDIHRDSADRSGSDDDRLLTAMELDLTQRFNLNSYGIDPCVQDPHRRQIVGQGVKRHDPPR